jgi:hypothetical protein
VVTISWKQIPETDPGGRHREGGGRTLVGRPRWKPATQARAAGKGATPRAAAAACVARSGASLVGRVGACMVMLKAP